MVNIMVTKIPTLSGLNMYTHTHTHESHGHFYPPCGNHWDHLSRDWGHLVATSQATGAPEDFQPLSLLGRVVTLLSSYISNLLFYKRSSSFQFPWSGDNTDVMGHWHSRDEMSVHASAATLLPAPPPFPVLLCQVKEQRLCSLDGCLHSCQFFRAMEVSGGNREWIAKLPA